MKYFFAVLCCTAHWQLCKGLLTASVICSSVVRCLHIITCGFSAFGMAVAVLMPRTWLFDYCVHLLTGPSSFLFCCEAQEVSIVQCISAEPLAA